MYFFMSICPKTKIINYRYCKNYKTKNHAADLLHDFFGFCFVLLTST